MKGSSESGSSGCCCCRRAKQPYYSELGFRRQTAWTRSSDCKLCGAGQFLPLPRPRFPYLCKSSNDTRPLGRVVMKRELTRRHAKRWAQGPAQSGPWRGAATTTSLSTGIFPSTSHLKCPLSCGKALEGSERKGTGPWCATLHHADGIGLLVEALSYDIFIFIKSSGWPIGNPINNKLTGEEARRRGTRICLVELTYILLLETAQGMGS